MDPKLCFVWKVWIFWLFNHYPNKYPRIFSKKVFIYLEAKDWEGHVIQKIKKYNDTTQRKDNYFLTRHNFLYFHGLLRITSLHVNIHFSYPLVRSFHDVCNPKLHQQQVQRIQNGAILTALCEQMVFGGQRVHWRKKRRSKN